MKQEIKKLFNIAFLYCILAMIGGVFFREFTRMNNFNGVTSLSLIHTHFFVLGTFLFLVLIFIEKEFKISKIKNYNASILIYNLGLIITSIMFFIRGICDVSFKLSSMYDKIISGFSGIGHITLGIGLVMILLIIKKSIYDFVNK
ncbi:MAG: DUF2871 domain-containing protein [Bacilli bacterium]